VSAVPITRADMRTQVFERLMAEECAEPWLREHFTSDALEDMIEGAVEATGIILDSGEEIPLEVIIGGIFEQAFRAGWEACRQFGGRRR